jgi:hypothetical protein
MSKIRQLKALMIKNYIHSKRHYCSLICELLAPIIIIAFLALLRSQIQVVQYDTTQTEMDKIITRDSRAIVPIIDVKDSNWYGLNKLLST